MRGKAGREKWIWRNGMEVLSGNNHIGSQKGVGRGSTGGGGGGGRECGGERLVDW